MTCLARRLSEHFDVPLDARDLALSLVAAPIVLAGLWAGLALLVAVAVPT